MNIKFSYLHRDASNFKQFTEIVFENPKQIALEDLLKIIQSKLLERSWFIPTKRYVSDLDYQEYSRETKSD